ncbi:MAG: hypothetical protein IKG22_09940 [Atopobiaceae bacterium]|nr:hypothetical protein [Atopobiaceae bacterium]
MRSRKTSVALFLAFVLAFVLAACDGNASSSNSSAAGNGTAAANETVAGGEVGSIASAAANGEFSGKPWVTSIVAGNLPPEAPKMNDDLYTFANYEYLASHQQQPSSAMQDHAIELQTANVATIKDTSKSSHDLDQLRIFFEQASDAEGLQKIGLSELQPYLDRIDAVTSIDEMNALLTADDFPFSPFLVPDLSLTDTRDVNIVAISANLVLVDPLMIGGMYYQDTDDPQAQESMTKAVKNTSSPVLADLMALGMDNESVNAAFEQVLSFERAHGKYVDYDGMFLSEPFGAMSEYVRDCVLTHDELYAACSNFPMGETLDKLGKGGSPRYVVSREWLKAFDDLWINENLEPIKMIAKMKVLAETRPYRDPSALNQINAQNGQPVPDAQTFAYEACNQQDTFAIVLAKNYVDEVLGKEAQERLTNLAQNLVNTYKDLVSNTPWLGEASQQRIIEKLDNMTLNVLEPAGGYYDFSGLELTPTNKGGTLLGNYLKLKQYRLDQESKMVGKPAVAACPWYTIRPTELNAFYDSDSNSINIYPGYVTSLVYKSDMSDPELLAGIGFVIGHEINHGFDFMGAQTDGYGMPNPVLDGSDADAFVGKTMSLATYYNGIEVAPGIMVNGQKIVAEAAADLCGMQAILEYADKTEEVNYETFFKDFAHLRALVAPEKLLPNLLIDTHPLDNLRINVCAQMFSQIYDELGVVEGDAMFLAPDKRINIWGENA